MRTHLLDNASSTTRTLRTTAPYPWAGAAWAADAPPIQATRHSIPHWSEMERDWAGNSRPIAAAPLESNATEPQAADAQPVTPLTLACLVLAALVSGLLVFNLMRVLIG